MIPGMRRDYAGPGDLRDMQRLVGRTWSRSSTHTIGALAWGRFAHTGREPEWPTAIWAEDGETVAFAWASLPGSGLDICVDPAHAGLVPEILAWFEATVPGPTRNITLQEGDTHITDVLADHGYAPEEGEFTVYQERDLEDLPTSPLPAGYRLRVLEDDDAAAWIPLMRASFPNSRVDTTSYGVFRSAWPFRRELHWVAEAPGGTFAATALMWLDEDNATAQLEPVGTHRDHRRKGLGSAVCLAAMRAAKDLGARTALVFPPGDDERPIPRSLYESIGFRSYARDVTWVKSG